MFRLRLALCIVISLAGHCVGSRLCAQDAEEIGKRLAALWQGQRSSHFNGAFKFRYFAVPRDRLRLANFEEIDTALSALGDKCTESQFETLYQKLVSDGDTTVVSLARSEFIFEENRYRVIHRMYQAHGLEQVFETVSDGDKKYSYLTAGDHKQVNVSPANRPGGRLGMKFSDVCVIPDGSLFEPSDYEFKVLPNGLVSVVNRKRGGGVVADPADGFIHRYEVMYPDFPGQPLTVVYQIGKRQAVGSSLILPVASFNLKLKPDGTARSLTGIFLQSAVSNVELPADAFQKSVAKDVVIIDSYSKPTQPTVSKSWSDGTRVDQFIAEAQERRAARASQRVWIYVALALLIGGIVILALNRIWRRASLR